MLLRPLAFLAASACLLADDWRPVRGGILGGISDLALVEHTPDHSTFLIVHDNKAPGDPRTALITVSGAKAVTYQSLDWNFDPECIDLESISAVPGHPGEFLAPLSAGELSITFASLPTASQPKPLAASPCRNSRPT